jgi:uncharacterized membrane protein YkvA (DUF1232 family)
VNQAIRLSKVARNTANPWFVRLVCGLAVCYLIFPFDFLPDLMPVIGWMDDLLVAAGLVTWLVGQRKKLAFNKALNK